MSVISKVYDVYITGGLVSGEDVNFYFGRKEII